MWNYKVRQTWYMCLNNKNLSYIPSQVGHACDRNPGHEGPSFVSFDSHLKEKHPTNQSCGHEGLRLNASNYIFDVMITHNAPL